MMYLSYYRFKVNKIAHSLFVALMYLGNDYFRLVKMIDVVPENYKQANTYRQYYNTGLTNLSHNITYKEVLIRKMYFAELYSAFFDERSSIDGLSSDEYNMLKELNKTDSDTIDFLQESD